MSFTFVVRIDGQTHTAVLWGGPGMNTLRSGGYKGNREDFQASPLFEWRNPERVGMLAVRLLGRPKLPVAPLERWHPHWALSAMNGSL